MARTTTTIAGTLPADMRESILKGETKITLDSSVSKEELSPKEALDFLGGDTRPPGLVITYNIDEGVHVTTKSALAAEKKEKAIERITSVADTFSELSPEFKVSTADPAIEQVKSASCSACRVNGVVRMLITKFAEYAYKNDIDITSDFITERLSKADLMSLKSKYGLASTEKFNMIGNKVEMRRADIPLPANAGGARPSCADCFRKHIGKAIVQLEEAELGYPQHFWLAMANLSEAESESVTDWPMLAAMVREVRIEMSENRGYKPDLMQFFDMIDELTGNVENG
jgi:hypothetical protein